MTRRARSVLWIVTIIALVAGFLYWQMSRLSRGLRTMPMRGATEVLVGSLSAKVLAPDLAQDVSKPVLDQYRNDPGLAHQQYILVMTWLHASKIFKSAAINTQVEGVMISSVSLTDVPQEDRVDGWGNPYCVLAGSRRITFLSSGGNGVLSCEDEWHAAEQAASKARDSRLTKEGALLAAVYERGKAGVLESNSE
jgi:hypothetical protein